MSTLTEAITDQKTDTGHFKLSSPELTGLDLLRYVHVAGTIDSIATVLSDLGAKMKVR
ncbi:type IV toxin-antitoxin system AbiEi family antitoxin [Bradyrhizobium ivorense]|uniref:type IV toxin-antitoxin system AbiEi family antitoxin n=1 Tax=Bradyrhizobium ivorense TaxID=2511166 RepID=UPI003D312237